jgi:twitching motility protein PilI
MQERDDMAADPFDTLIDIEQKCRRFAKPLPRQQVIGKVWQGIGFIASDLNFVTPLTEIVEILPLPELTSVPAGADWFKGVANLRGRLLPITDLQGFIFGKPQYVTPLSRVLVVEFEQTGVGFLVSQVLGIQRFYENTLQPAVLKDFEPGIQEHMQGMFELDSKNWHILSLKGISQTSQFYHVLKEMGA